MSVSLGADTSMIWHHMPGGPGIPGSRASRPLTVIDPICFMVTPERPVELKHLQRGDAQR